MVKSCGGGERVVCVGVWVENLCHNHVSLSSEVKYGNFLHYCVFEQRGGGWNLHCRFG